MTRVVPLRGIVAGLALVLAALGVPGPARSPHAPPVAQLVAADKPRPKPPLRPKPPPVRTASVVMNGDLLWHNTVWEGAAADHAVTGKGYDGLDFDPMFAELKPVVAGADLAICHAEVPFAAPGAPYQSYPVFAAPPQIARWTADMGWDLCVTSSNHSLDQGYDGLVRTLGLFDRAGVAHVGTYRSAADRRRPTIVTTATGVRIGVVAGTYGLNGFAPPQGKAWSVSTWDARNLLRQAHAARRAGADVVLVAVHWGVEYDHLPTAEQVALARTLTASPDVDLVFGEHAHVVQPITKVNGKWVVYGMGNTVAQQDPGIPATYEGITVRFTFSGRRGEPFAVRRAEYLPTTWNYLGSGPIRIRRVVPDLARGEGDQARLLQARASIREAVTGLGRPPGLRES